MSTLISSIGLWNADRRNHGRHERIDNTNLVDTDEETTSNVNNNNNQNNNNENSNNVNAVDSVDIEAAETSRVLPEQNETNSSNVGRIENNDNNREESGTVAELQVDEESGPDESTQVRYAVRHEDMVNMNEERELMRRRNFACNAVLIIVLARLWAQAIFNSDPSLLIMCLFTTSWAVKWIRMRHAAEQAMDRRIEQFYSSNSETTAPRNRAIDGLELSLMSFQSQLAMAIMESQRQMVENGGYGRPDDSVVTEGVSEQAKSSWHRYSYQPSSDLPLKPEEEQPSCSVCLCEYEQGDRLVQLPCKHIYHEECITAWCNNNIRCPLCNSNLENNDHE